jgi:hypothetical protein
MPKSLLVALTVLLLNLAGCAYYPLAVQEKKVIRAVGHGASVEREDQSEAQGKLLAMRASKMDAYRNLAEQVNGLKVDSSTSVSQMSMRSDLIRAYVNATIRGAVVIDVNPLSDGSYETILELEIDNRFFGCLRAVNGCDYVSGFSGSPCMTSGCNVVRDPVWRQCADNDCVYSPYTYHGY